MRQPRKTDWNAIRQRYENTKERVADICDAAGVSPDSFNRRRSKEKWRRKSPVRQTAPEIPDSTPAPAVPPPDAPAGEVVAAKPKRKPATTPAARRKLLGRLASAISLKLEQLERRMESDLDQDDQASATDHERETRAIGALIDNLGKIEEMEGNLGRGKAGKSTAAATDLADDADRYRRELAQRLQRIVEASGRKP